MISKSQKKKLDTLKKRKRVINNLFKKDKKINKILMKYEQNLLYEDPEEEMRIHRNEQSIFQIFKFVKKNKNYTDFYLKNVEFGPSSEFFAAGALGSGIETGQYISTHLLHIKYNKNLDSFVATGGISSNTYNKLCIFNDAQNFSFDIWENEDPRSKSNSLVGEERYKKISSSELPKNLLNLFTENTFDELYTQVWEKNHEKFDNKKMLDNFPGTYQASMQLLYFNKDSSILNTDSSTSNIYYTFEAPTYINNDKTKCLGRAVQSFEQPLLNDPKKDGVDLSEESNKINHILLSYSMIWDKNNLRFNILLIDNDDISVFSLLYNGLNIEGSKFETPQINLGKIKSINSFVGVTKMKKIKSTQFNIPTYNELYSELNLTESE